MIAQQHHLFSTGKDKYVMVSREVFYIVFLLLVVGCYYFTLSDTLYIWFMEDELVLSQTYHNLGLLGCVKYYYLHTTINRLSADFYGCLIAQFATWTSTPFVGWVFARLVVYTLIPISLAFLLREMIKIPFKFSVIVALLLSSAGIFIILNDYNNHVYGLYALDLVIYGTSIVTFFTLVALFPKSIDSRRYFKWFCLIYALNLLNHEIFLVISGFFIPLYGWYRYVYHRDHSVKLSFNRLIGVILRDRRVWILLTIYLVSSLISILSPGMKIRQQIWPTTGSAIDGFAYMGLAIEEAIFKLYRVYMWVAAIFLLGILCRWFVADKFQSKYKLLYGLVFSAPFIYLAVMSLLVGMTPTIWGTALRPESFQVIRSLLAHIVVNQKVLNQGGFYVSRVLCFYVGIFLNIFLAGFFIAGVFQKQVNGMAVRKIWPFTTVLFAIVFIGFSLHPDGAGGLRTLLALFKSDINFMSPALKVNSHAPLEHSLVSLDRFGMLTLSHQLFPKKGPGDHRAAVTNMVVDRYFKVNRGGAVSPQALERVYDPIVTNSKIVHTMWNALTYSLYHVFPKEPCAPLFATAKADHYCYGTFGEKPAIAQLAHQRLGAPTTIPFRKIHGIKIQDDQRGDMRIVDRSTRGEHFIASDDLQLSKGLYYFTFEAKPTSTELYLYLFGKKKNLFLSWNHSFFRLGKWSTIGHNNSLKPVFSQVEVTPQLVKLSVVVASAIRQKIHLRWQHGYGDRMVYRGSKGNVSKLCKVQFGKIMT